MSAPDGGPAFPVPTDVYHTNLGMSLRDWFAGQALNGIVQDCMFERLIPDGGGKTETDLAAERAYKMADAMLKARSQP